VVFGLGSLLSLGPPVLLIRLEAEVASLAQSVGHHTGQVEELRRQAAARGPVG